MNKFIKIFISILLFFVLITPFVINLFTKNEFIIDSTSYIFNSFDFIEKFIQNKSWFMAGNNSIALFSYIVFFIIFAILDIFISQIHAYFIFIIISYLISFYCSIKLFSEIAYKNDNIYLYVIINLLSFLFLSSLSNFNLFTSTIFFNLSNISLPILLYCNYMYYKYNKKIYLVGILVFSLFSIVNLTNLVLNIIFVNIVTITLNFNNKINILLKNIFISNLFLLPSVILSIIPIIIGLQYVGNDITSSFQNFREDFYSINTNYINIFKQTTFWGLFGSFNGKLYYEFSKFYQSSISSFLGLTIYIYMFYLLINNKFNNIHRTQNNILLILFLIIFQFMLGLKNPIYEYLYNNFTYFQIFRNITKLSHLLLYLTLIIIVFNLKNITKRKFKQRFYLISISIISIAIMYNIPYFTYSKYFFEERSIENIPSKYKDVSIYLNQNLGLSDKVLILPGTYINERYNFDGKEFVPQGYMFDYLLNNINSYRVAQDLVGSSQFISDSKKVYYKDNNDFKIDKNNLRYLINKYNFNYVVITEDLVSEYQDIVSIKDFLSVNNFNLLKSFENITVYENDEFFKSKISTEYKSNLKYRYNNPKYINIKISNIVGLERLYYLDWFNKNWSLYLNPIDSNSKDCNVIQEYNNEGKNIKECEHTQKFFEGEELSYLWKQPVFEDSHKLVYDYANQWTIDPEYIKANFDKSMYKENPDGSIDLELTLYFKPQSYFYLGIIISGTTLILCLSYLGYTFYRQRKQGSLSKIDSDSVGE